MKPDSYSDNDAITTHDKILISNIIGNIKKDDRYKCCLKSIPDSILSKFIHGLFDNGRHDIGNGLKIIDAYTDNNGKSSVTSLFCNENASSFVEYGLIEVKENRITDRKYYEVSGITIGHEVWLFANKKESSICLMTDVIEPKPVKVAIGEVANEIERIIKKYNGIATSELRSRRDALECRRKQMMLQVARAIADGRGNHTSVNVKEGSAERFATIVDEFDIALGDRNLAEINKISEFESMERATP
ncbi:hypothetical protein J8Z82_14635 [Yersinia enterocolitica]|uniref:hypothetical protein n=1 Tax=Yersinia enterocolitica TaxID=630 RepID=UPI001C8EABFF|nr:hypothetical protein [Yersinia enterocolitica]MBX9488815.1 hypothetical protein [Yersinia enterocolitica]MBX9493011.1 hypothetical protein [Yersinia enterocolitica]